MDDLIKRLRGWPPSVAHNVMQDAADRIEALESRIAKADALADALESSGNVTERHCRALHALVAYREGSDT